MSNAKKHKERSGYNHNAYKPFRDFERKGRVKKVENENKNFLTILFKKRGYR